MSKVMSWVTVLPEVGDVLLNKRDRIQAIYDKAKALEVEAMNLRNDAYFAALELESRVRANYKEEEIIQAKKQTAT